MSGYQFEADDSVTMNVLACAPKFFLSPSNHIVHFQPTQIQIYTALSGTKIRDAIDAVATAYSNSLSNVSFVRTEVDCGTGPTCLRIDDASLPNACAATAGNTTGNASNGEITGNATITLRSDWSTSSITPNALKYRLAHEMGHYLGLDDHYDGVNPCDPTYSVMHAPIACDYSPNDPFPKISNYLPINNTVYAGGPRTSCGF
jgi:hypothetical protein